MPKIEITKTKKETAKKKILPVRKNADKNSLKSSKTGSATKLKKAIQNEKSYVDILSPPRGMRDILPADASPRDKVIEVSRRIAEFYDFSEINTPVLEKADLFTRSV